MARQKGIIKLVGRVGDVSFYKSQDGYLAREKGGVDGARIASDPAFQRTRENGSEFARAGVAGKLLRDSLSLFLANCSDNRMVGRLTREMVKVIQADATNARGLRNVIDGEAELLEGFEFNINSKVTSRIRAPYTTEVDRATGILTIRFGPFVPLDMISAPEGATHFKITNAAVEMDFENGTYVISRSMQPAVAIDNHIEPNLALSNAVTPNSTHPLFMTLGIEFLQIINGLEYPLRNKSYNAMTLLKVVGN